MVEFRYRKGAGGEVALAGFRAMNSAVELLIAGKGKQEARWLGDTALSIVRDYEKRYSRFDKESIVCRLAGSPEGFRPDSETAAILRHCEFLNEATSGYFDIRYLCRSLFADGFQQTGRPEVEGPVDLGGYLKGYVAVKIKEFLGKQGVKSAVVNMGDSSVSVIGTMPSGESWTVTVESEGGSVSLPLGPDGSASVSGPKRNGDPERRFHIIDPVSEERVVSRETVCVTGPDGAVCEALSTALYACPEEIRNSTVKRFDGYHAYLICNGKLTRIEFK